MITPEDITKLAALARIKVTDSEKDKFVKEIDAVLEYVSQIKSVNTGGIKNLIGGQKNVMRDDKNSHEPELFTEPILKQAPLTENGYIKVKKILTS